ncbi:MAG: hypothetical protein GQ565_03025 [Candidatus Aegiribacteria sp.]|nr:hypothetical protein [Candidatus Aegiribacteria sp.]
MSKRVLVIGDLHCPVEHPGYLKFCKQLYKEHACNTTVLIGDVVDWHAISYHDKEPECPGAIDEYIAAKAKVKKWHRAFPGAYVCLGNHDIRPQRKAKSAGVPDRFLKSYSDLWGTPTWTWDFNYMIDDVYYCHGTGKGGIHPAWNKSTKLGMSVVMGHCHARAGVKWHVNPIRRWFGMDVGCGIDNDAFQFVYGRNIDDKPIISAGVVCAGMPQHFIMPMARGEKYHKSRFSERTNR